MPPASRFGPKGTPRAVSPTDSFGPQTGQERNAAPRPFKGRIRLLLLGEPCGCLRHIFLGLLPKKMLPEETPP